MSKNKKVAFGRPCTYASAYAILTDSNCAGSPCGTFLARTGETAWPCQARLLDTMAEAIEAVVKAGLEGVAQIVRIDLSCAIEAVSAEEMAVIAALA